MLHKLLIVFAVCTLSICTMNAQASNSSNGGPSNGVIVSYNSATGNGVIMDDTGRPVGFTVENRNLSLEIGQDVVFITINKKDGSKKIIFAGKPSVNTNSQIGL